MNDATIGGWRNKAKRESAKQGGDEYGGWSHSLTNA